MLVFSVTMFPYQGWVDKNLFLLNMRF